MSYLLDMPLPCGWETSYNDFTPTPLEATELASAPATLLAMTQLEMLLVILVSLLRELRIPV